MKQHLQWLVRVSHILSVAAYLLWGTCRRLGLIYRSVKIQLVLSHSILSFVQVCGYGHSHVYHGDNEYCSLSAMQSAMKILSKLLDCYNK